MAAVADSSAASSPAGDVGLPSMVSLAAALLQ